MGAASVLFTRHTLCNLDIYICCKPCVMDRACASGERNGAGDTGDLVHLWAGLMSGVIVQLLCASARKWHTTACVMVEVLQLSYARAQGNASALVIAFYLFTLD